VRPQHSLMSKRQIELLAAVCHALVVLSFLLCSHVELVFGQGARGSLVGAVMDPSGAVIPSATVSATHLDIVCGSAPGRIWRSRTRVEHSHPGSEIV
jgi:hypothetical protein